MDRIIIIGSGISGLTSALLLHNHGYDVMVVEQQAQPGGALHRFKRNGFSFDVGFHYTGGLGKDHILSKLWRYCDIEKDITPIAFPEASADCIQVNGYPETVHAYYDYDSYQEELLRHFPKEKDGIISFFKTIKTAGENNPFYNLDMPLTDFLRELAFPEKMTLGMLIRSCTTDPVLQAILSHPVFLHGVRPDDIGLILHAAVAHPVYSSMYTVEQGGQGIADAYLRQQEKCNIEVVTNTSVNAILTTGGKVSGIATQKGNYAASQVIYTGHPALLPNLATESMLRKVYCERLKEAPNTPSMFMVFGVVKDGLENSRLRWNNYYALPSGLSIPFIDTASSEECFFLSGCGLREQENDNIPDREYPIILMRPAAWEETTKFDLGRKKRTQDYETWKVEQEAALVNAVNRKWDGLLKGFRVINTASPLTFRDELKYVRGSVYGVQHRTDQFAIGARTKLPGLWLSGQSTLLSGIIGAALSAVVTVGGIVGLEPLWDKIRNC